MEHRPDEELILAAGRGDRSAFGILVERRHRAVMQFVCRFLGITDRGSAEDLVQDVFLAAWRAAPSFRPRTDTRALSWIFRITTNICLNYRRSADLRVVVPIDADGHPQLAADSRPEASVLGRESARRVREALAKLPPTQRAAILLREFHELPYAEIATVLETSVSAVESLLVRARKSLNAALMDPEAESSPQVSPDLRAECL